MNIYIFVDDWCLFCVYVWCVCACVVVWHSLFKVHNTSYQKAAFIVLNNIANLWMFGILRLS